MTVNREEWVVTKVGEVEEMEGKGAEVMHWVCRRGRGLFSGVLVFSGSEIDPLFWSFTHFFLVFLVQKSTHFMEGGFEWRVSWRAGLSGGEYGFEWGK